MSVGKESIFDWMSRLVEARKCCGTCAGGVIADRDRVILAAQRERIAQAIEAMEGNRVKSPVTGFRSFVSREDAARIARNST